MVAPTATVAFVPREVFSTTQRSLETLYERTPGPLRLVCVDGGSPAPVREYLESASQRYGFTLLRTDRYLTPNESRNLAAAEALRDPATKHVVFVDNDVLVAHGWLDALVRCADETGAWVVGPAYYEHLPERSRLHMFGGVCRFETDPTGRRRYVELHDHGHASADQVEEPLARQPTELIEFHTVLVSRQAFEQLGPLDEGLPCHAEHGDLCLQVRQAGGEVYLEPESEITYVPPRRLEPEDREFFFLRWSEAWMRANRLHFAAKWGLDPGHPDDGAAERWLTEHRRYGYASLAKLRRLVGPKLKRSFEKRVFAPLERVANRWQYPYAKYCERRPPAVEVVNRPVSSVAA